MYLSVVFFNDKLEGNLDNIGCWVNANRLKMNSKKTKVIYFGPQSALCKTSQDFMRVRDDIVPRSTCVKYLGVMLDDAHYIEMQISYDQHYKKNQAVKVSHAGGLFAPFAPFI